MVGYVGAIETQTLKNTFFRRVLFTGKHAQLVVMCLQPGEEIGDEVHLEHRPVFSHRAGGSEVHLQRERGAHRAQRGSSRGSCRDLPQCHQYFQGVAIETVYGLLAAESSRGYGARDQGGGRRRGAPRSDEMNGKWWFTRLSEVGRRDSI